MDLVKKQGLYFVLEPRWHDAYLISQQNLIEKNNAILYNK